MTPPTVAMLVLSLVQLGIIWAAQPLVSRLTSHPLRWHIVVATSGVIMTLYLWHLSAMSLIAAAGLNLADGALFRIEPASPLWWLSRPLWLLLLSSVTLALMAVFARFEWRIQRGRAHPLAVGVGLLMTNVAVAKIALDGLATPEAEVNWIITLSVIVGAAAIRAYPPPQRERREAERTAA